MIHLKDIALQQGSFELENIQLESVEPRPVLDFDLLLCFYTSVVRKWNP